VQREVSKRELTDRGGQFGPRGPTVRLSLKNLGQKLDVSGVWCEPNYKRRTVRRLIGISGQNQVWFWWASSSERRMIRPMGADGSPVISKVWIKKFFFSGA